MSWLFSRVLVEDCSALMPAGSKQCALSNVIGTADACLSSDKTSEPFQPSRYGMTFVLLTVEPGEVSHKWLLAGFRVNHLVRLHEDGERR